MRASLPAIVVLSACLALAGCSSAMRGPDRSFARADYAVAATGYRAALAGALSPDDEARALYRLGLLAAIPGGDTSGSAQARHWLDLLLERFPGSVYTLPARAILALQDDAEAATQRATELAAEVERLERAARASEAAAQAQEAMIARLRTSLANTEAELRRVRSELEQLKAIDLRRR